MKVAKSLLLGSAAVLATVVGAQAADLPTRKAAPVQYVKICDAYGAGFFYIPGTDTCLRVGGLVLAQTRIQGSSQMWAMAPHAPGTPLGGIAAVGPGGGVSVGVPMAIPTYGYIPATAGFRSAIGYGRDQFGFDAQGRVELDARNQTAWGTVRTFLRLTGTFGTGLNSTTGSYGNLGALVFGTTGVAATVAKDFTYLDKAFIQFAGITAGRAQSMFDFYADATNYEALRGSNQNVWELAYTATFGGGFSATLSIEDVQSHRGAVASVVNVAGYPGLAAGPLAGTGAVIGTTAASRLPEIVGNIRVDQPWGSAQIMGALHSVRAAGYNTFMGATWPLAQSNKMGFAVGGGVKFNLDMLAPGDALWMQAIYAKGAMGYTSGVNMAFVTGPNTTQNYGIGVARQSNGYGWNNAFDNDCVITFSGQCELSTSWALTAALTHYWSPSVRSNLFGSFYRVTYSNNAVNPVAPTAVLAGGPFFFAGMTNYAESRLGANVIWSPIKNFDIGGELMWIRGVTSRPTGLAPDYALNAAGLPAWRSVNDSFFGKVRMLRAF